MADRLQSMLPCWPWSIEHEKLKRLGTCPTTLPCIAKYVGNTRMIHLVLAWCVDAVRLQKVEVTPLGKGPWMQVTIAGHEARMSQNYERLQEDVIVLHWVYVVHNVLLAWCCKLRGALEDQCQLRDSMLNRGPRLDALGIGKFWITASRG